MTTEMITLKLDSVFLKNIDAFVKTEHYQNRTEFIRDALREKLDDAKLKQALLAVKKLKGASKKKTTPEEYEQARERAVDRLIAKDSSDVFRLIKGRDVN